MNTTLLPTTYTDDVGFRPTTIIADLARHRPTDGFPKLSAQWHGTLPASLLTVHVPGAELDEVNDWLSSHTSGRCEIFSRFNWTVRRYHIARRREGVTVTFAELSDATWFRMAWCADA